MDRKIYMLCCCDRHAIDFALRHLNAQNGRNVRRIHKASDLWGLDHIDLHKLPCWNPSPMLLVDVEHLVKTHSINIISHDS